MKRVFLNKTTCGSPYGCEIPTVNSRHKKINPRVFALILLCMLFRLFYGRGYSGM